MGIIQASIPLFFVLIAIELLFTRWGRRSWYRLNDSIADLSAGTLSQIAGIFTKLLLIGAYGWLFERVRLQQFAPIPAWPDGAMFTRLDGSPRVHGVAIVGWLIAFLVVDLAYYWFHRVSHEVNLFWAGHVVHHSSEEYNLAVALRQTALGGVLSWVFYMPLAMLGMSLTQFATCYAVNLIYQFWIHTRAVGRLPTWAEAILNTPSHHRVHHGVNPEYQDRNYAGVFIVWDRWFGTFTPEGQEPVYGLTTPLRSWNPLWAQVHQYVAIARNVLAATTWHDRWHHVFGSPGWRPRAAGGPVVIPPVTARTFLKFDPAVSTVLARYALIHFALAIPPALWLLSTASTLAPVSLAAGCFYLSLTLTNIGGVLEARRWAYVTESARLVALGTALAWLTIAPSASAALPWRSGRGLAAAGAVLAFGSFLVIRQQRARFTMTSDESMDVGHPVETR